MQSHFFSSPGLLQPHYSTSILAREKIDTLYSVPSETIDFSDPSDLEEKSLFFKGKGDRMDISGGMADIKPEKMGLHSKFRFRCHSGFHCFTKCCRGIKITLTPCDVIRLKNRVRLSSEEFLSIYTDPHLLGKTDLPMITLKLMDDDEKSCPFVRKNGCIIYQDRPTTCRYYPLGSGTLIQKKGSEDDGFYFFVNERYCHGLKEDKEWTVLQWRKDQGVDIHDEINTLWADLVVRKRSFPPDIKLIEQAKKMFFMVSYNIDKLREFVFESSFLDRYDIGKKTIQKIETNEIDLLEFGLKWLRNILFKEGAFQLKPDSAGKRKVYDK